MSRHKELKKQQRARQKRKHQAQRTASELAFPHLAEAEEAFFAGLYSRARREAEKALRIKPRSRDALDIMVRCLLMAYEPAVALPFAQRLVEVDPQNPWSHMALTDCQKLLGQTVAALDSVRECLRLIPRQSKGSASLSPLYRDARLMERQLRALLRSKDSKVKPGSGGHTSAGRDTSSVEGILEESPSAAARKSTPGAPSRAQPGLPFLASGISLESDPPIASPKASAQAVSVDGGVGIGTGGSAGSKKPVAGAPPADLSAATATRRDAAASSVSLPVIPENYRIPLEFSIDETALESLLSHVQTSSLQDYRLRLDFAHVALQREFDELLCLPTLQGVDYYWHQVETARRVLKHYRGRVLLADEVGLGKTIEAGLVLKEYWLRGIVRRALILAPASLVDQWQEEMASKFGLEFATTDLPRYSKDPAGFWKETPLVICSIHQARSAQNFPLLTAIDYDLVIVDEAHCLRNRNSLNWKLVNAVRKKFLLLLSATPVQNDLVELFNLITVLKPGLLKTEAQFRKEYVQAKNPRQPRNEESLRRLLREVMIRNTRSQLALGLPRRYAATAVAHPSPPERSLYERLSAYVRSRYENGSSAQRFALQTLQMQAGSSPRALGAGLENFWNKHGDPGSELVSMLEAARELQGFTKGEKLIEIINLNPTKVVVFTKYLHTLETLADLCREAGFSHAVYHGSLGRSEKDEAIEHFRKEARLLLSTELGGEGHNLQFCHTLVNFDLPWNPMKIEQRVGRLQRIGQTRDVFVFNLCQTGSIEEYLLQVLDSKLNMFQLVIGEVETILGVLEEENDFQSIVMDLWVQSASESERAAHFDQLGDRLLEAKQRYVTSCEMDARIFGDA